MLRATCPNNPKHEEFVVVLYVPQKWIVARDGFLLGQDDYIESDPQPPTVDDVWVCWRCGDRAKVEEVENEGTT